MSGRLANKVAIVTGGGSGIGHAICRVFAREGASVAVLDINEDNAKKTSEVLTSSHGNKHCALSMNVGVPNQTKESINLVEEKLGKKSDILVNSAGVIRDSMLLKMTESQFDDVINVNLKGTFMMTQEFVKSLIGPNEKRPGSIINISSIVAKSGNIGQTNYAASKAGVIGMTKTIAQEFGKYNIRCNAILPGFIITPMTDKIPEDIIKMVAKTIPLGRQGQPEEIANACLFLASDESSYVTGSCLEVTGGLGA